MKEFIPGRNERKEPRGLQGHGLSLVGAAVGSGKAIEQSQSSRASHGLSSSLYGINLLMSASAATPGAKSDVVVMMPFETFPSIVSTPIIARTSFAVTR